MKEEVLLKKLGQRIKQIREEKGILQVAFADEIGYDKSNTSRLESGRLNMRIGTLYKVSQALGITLSELVKVED